MALVKCPACEKDVSEDATVCPHCGKQASAYGAIGNAAIGATFGAIYGGPPGAVIGGVAGYLWGKQMDNLGFDAKIRDAERKKLKEDQPALESPTPEEELPTKKD